MALQTQTYPHALACQDAVVQHAQAARAHGLRPVLLVPSHGQQLAAQQWLAARACGFGITVSTLLSWVENLWELFGNGSTIVSSEMRAVTLWKMLHASDSLQHSPGMANMLNRCSFEAAPSMDIATCSAAAEASFSESERATIELLADYRAQLHAQRLVEFSEALDALTGHPCMKNYALLVLDTREDQMTFVQHAFLDACDATLIRNGHSGPPLDVTASCSNELARVQRLLFRRTPEDEPVGPEGAVRIALAAGPSASNRLVCDVIGQALSQGCDQVVVACADPCALFDFAAPLLAQQNIGCSLTANRNLGETDVGRALLQLGELTTAPSMDDPQCTTPLTAADYAYNPFSAIGRTSAFNIDRMHRRDRLTSQNAILTDLSASADTLAQGIIPLIEEGDALGALNCLQAYLDHRFAAQPAYYAEQHRALERIRALCAADADLPLAALALIGSEDPIPVHLGNTESAPVQFTTQREAARLGAGSVDCVVLANLNAEDFPVRDPENALATLLGKLGAAAHPDPLAQARDTFAGAFETARNLVVLQRCLNDDRGDPSQPAIVFDELIDCYRRDLQSDKDVDRTLGIPESLLPFTVQRGEQDVLENVGAGTRPLRTCLQPETGAIGATAHSLIALPHRYNEGTFEGLDMSPSQVESYVECPYNWFAKRRLQLETLDEGFSPLERGTFIHDILHRFYLRFQAEVQPKVTADTLEAARRIMRETFDAVCADQPQGRFGSRYVPLTAWEHKERQAVLPKLIDYLDVEARLLPTFEPREFEWQFANDRPLAYAGCNLRGCTDRIDVDAQGRAVVIDYKSSLSNTYRLFDASAKDVPVEFQLPKKLQALMYARIVREWFGCQVVGALYVNPLKGTVLGAYDGRLIDVDEIPFAGARDAESCRVPYAFAQTFDELLDRCESKVAQHLERLAAGDIHPRPSGQEACEYCPVNVCESRLAPRKI